jgi:hypothetical protein
MVSADLGGTNKGLAAQNGFKFQHWQGFPEQIPLVKAAAKEYVS